MKRYLIINDFVFVKKMLENKVTFYARNKSNQK